VWVWVAFLLVGRSACFLWLLLTRITWISKESEAAAAVGVSVAVCRYGAARVRGPWPLYW